jgi:branched-chain amino acid transport system ATP-binding protein
MLKVVDLETSYGRLKALHGVSIDVPAGSIVTLIGANGAGKTTLLHSIVGVLRPTAGEILFEGARIDGRPPWDIVRRGIAPCPEGRRVWPQMSVLENLEMGGYTVSAATELQRRIEAVFAHFPILADRQTQKAGSLSGGEQQMLAIARAILRRPKLLMLDEPSLGLSPIMARSVYDTLRKVSERDMTILLVEQNARMALDIADYGYIMEAGRIVLKGTSQELKENNDVKELYLGLEQGDASEKGWKFYTKRRRW